MTGSINNGKAEDWNAIGDEAHGQHSQQTQLRRLNHDMRASLAITNGFNQALEASLLDLVAEYQILLDSKTSTPHEPDLENVKKLEGDCRFCLSRMTRSIVKLGEDIESVTNLNTMEATPVAETPEVEMPEAETHSDGRT
ncbi:hypothetical protein N9383_04090 [Granulosicoccus sp.]|nr:hypothetical protein [Granulosicoccus sp.]